MPFRLFVLTVFLVLFSSANTSAQNSQTQKSEKSPGAISVGIVVDCSGSQRLHLERMLAVVKQIADTIAPGDEAFVVRFIDSSKISVVQDFTDQKDMLADAADSLYIEGGQTALIDAIDFSARHFSESTMSSVRTSRVLVLITDGDDRKSKSQADETIALLKQEKIRVFAIGIGDDKIASKLLDKFSKETGGKTYVPRTQAETTDEVNELAAAIRATIAAK